VTASTLPARIVGWSMLVLGLGLLCLIAVNPCQRGIIALFGGVLAVVGLAVFGAAKCFEKKTRVHS